MDPSLSVYQFPGPQRRTPHLLIVAPRGGLDVRKGLGRDRVELGALKVAVRTELDRPLRRRVGGGRFAVPEYAFAAAVLEPHQGWNDGGDLGHRAGKLREKNISKRRNLVQNGSLAMSWPLSLRQYKIKVTIKKNG